jgi:hypothetical protein
MEIYEGTSTVKEAKLYVYKGKFNEFTMKKDEDVVRHGYPWVPTDQAHSRP